jgi:two-component system cell cycle response regulator
MTARVLVVDDILANVKLLEARLAAEYFEVLTAHSGREALDVCARERVDVVLLDVMMPGMDGFEACRRLKADPATHHLPVVMVTALDQPSDRVQGLEAGADDFLTKPVDDIALVTRVKNLTRLKVSNDEMLAARGDRAPLASRTARRWRRPVRTRGASAVDDPPRSAARLVEALSKRIGRGRERCAVRAAAWPNGPTISSSSA